MTDQPGVGWTDDTARSAAFAQGDTDDRADGGDEFGGQGPGESLESDDVRTGLIDGQTFASKPVQYAVVGELAIFEGDIVLGRVEELERRTDELRAQIAAAAAGVGRDATPGDQVDPSAAEMVAEAAVVTGAGRRWPGGVVPFEIDPGLPGAQAQAARNAIAHWEERTRLAFPPRRASDAQWIAFHAADGCSSPVGRQDVSIFQPAGQQISLAAGCDFGRAVHEIGHSVGLWHEQSREDRDSFVSVQWANIKAGKAYNFDQHISDGDDVGPYDFGSIMHYGPTDFGKPSPTTSAPMTTITPIVPLPTGVTMGQRNALSIGDRGAVAWMYGSIYPSSANTWTGQFRGLPNAEFLYYSPARRRWYLSVATGSGMGFSDVGATVGFGDMLDGRPIWAAKFNDDAHTDLLFYYPGDDNWWLGRVLVEDAACAGLRGVAANQRRQMIALQQQKAGLDPRNPADLAEIREINDQISVLRGQQQATSADMARLSCPIDAPANPTGETLVWSLVGNTAGFGHGINDGRPFWVGDFTGGGTADVLFYYPSDDNWWLGSMQGGQLVWSLVGNTAGFGHGINDGRPFWVGDFTGGGTADVLFYYPGDDNWWLGSMQGGQLVWSLVGNTAGFGHGINDGRPFWVGDFTGGGTADVLFYYPGDDNWWLGSMQGGQLVWSFAGNTAGFGHGINDGRPFWVGDFTGGGTADVLFYYPGDDNWWLGSINDVVGENAECATLRSQIAQYRDTIRTLQRQKAGLNPRDPADLAEIRAINAEITSLNQQINVAKTRMAVLTCPATPNPGGRQLTWSRVGNTAGFGHGINDGRAFWTDDFTGDGHTDVMFHFHGDLNWWRATMENGSLKWALAGTW